MEEELWMVAAKQVLHQSNKPLHYTDIKRIILEQGLVNPGLKTTLEEALFKEIQRPGGRFRSILNQPGVFELVKTEVTEEAAELPPTPLSSPPTQPAHTPLSSPPTVPTRTPLTTIPTQPARATFISPNPKPSNPFTAPTSKFPHPFTAPTGQSLLRKPGIKTKVLGPSSRTKNISLTYAAAVQEKHRLKYKLLKRQIKDIMFVNAAVCDEVTRMEEKVQKAKDERRYLLARLLQHQARDDSHHQHMTASSPGGSTSGKHAAQSIAQILGEVEKRKKKTAPGLLPGGKKRSAKEILDDAPKARPKKKGLTGRKLVHQIPLDSLGRPVFPIELNHLTIYCLGEIVPERSSFNSAEYIYPVGFCSTRIYASIHKPEEHSLYTCKIIDTNAGPKFDISPEDAPECVFTAATIDACHMKLLRAINAVRGAEIVPLQPRGADFFGLSHPTIQNLIQSCPGAKKCPGYKWQRYEVSRLPPPAINIHEIDEPTVCVDTLYALPSFISLLKPTHTTQANLRTLLTTSTATG